VLSIAGLKFPLAGFSKVAEVALDVIKNEILQLFDHTKLAHFSYCLLNVVSKTLTVFL
jgi:hypothetical protein